MTLKHIKKALDLNIKVYFGNNGYEVIKDQRNQYLITHKASSNTIGLTHKDGITLNGKESKFFIYESSGDLLTEVSTHFTTEGKTEEALKECGIPLIHIRKEDNVWKGLGATTLNYKEIEKNNLTPNYLPLYSEKELSNFIEEKLMPKGDVTITNTVVSKIKVLDKDKYLDMKAISLGATKKGFRYYNNEAQNPELAAVHYFDNNETEVLYATTDGLSPIGKEIKRKWGEEMLKSLDGIVSIKKIEPIVLPTKKTPQAIENNTKIKI